MFWKIIRYNNISLQILIGRQKIISPNLKAAQGCVERGMLASGVACRGVWGGGGGGGGANLVVISGGSVQREAKLYFSWKIICLQKLLNYFAKSKRHKFSKKSRSHSIILDARNKFRLTNIRRQRTKFSSVSDLAPMLFVPLRQINENSRNNCDFLKGIISTMATVGITCLRLLKKQVRHWCCLVNKEELLSTGSNLSASADWLGSGSVFSVGWVPVLC